MNARSRYQQPIAFACLLESAHVPEGGLILVEILKQICVGHPYFLLVFTFHLPVFEYCG